MRVTPFVMNGRWHHRLPIFRPLRVAGQHCVRFMSTDKLFLNLHCGTGEVVECKYSRSILRGYTPDGVYLTAHLLMAALSVALVVLALALDHLLSTRSAHLHSLLSAYYNQ